MKLCSFERTYPTRGQCEGASDYSRIGHGPPLEEVLYDRESSSRDDEVYQGAGGGFVARGVISHFGLAVGKSAPGELFTQPNAS